MCTPAHARCADEICIGREIHNYNSSVYRALVFAPIKSRFTYDISLSAVSDYVSRGISGSASRPAIQGGADVNYAFSSNISLAAGIWSSNVYIPAQQATKEEIDSSVTSVVKTNYGVLTLTAVDYDYPGVHHDLGYNGVEFKVRLDHDLDSALALYSTATYFVAFANVDAYGQYFELGMRRASGHNLFDLGLDTHAGHLWFERHHVLAIADYYEYGLNVFRDWDGFEISLGITSSNLTQANCFGGLKICGTRLVGSLTRVFSW